MITQQGDVILYQTPDDGEIDAVNGVISMDGGLATAVYLSLFGGNEDDPGGDDETLSWWGNIGEVGARQYRSEAQNLLRDLPAVARNLRRVEDAAKRDLAWMVDEGAALSVEISASMPGVNRVKLVVTINGDVTLEFVENWGAAA